MSVQPQYLAYVLEQLAALGDVSTRRMFGAVGLYSGEIFFGLIDDDTLYFKTDGSNVAEYRARRMPRFMAPEGSGSDRGYYQVPADIIEDDEALAGWARKAVAVALASQAAKARPAPRNRAKGKRAISRRRAP